MRVKEGDIVLLGSDGLFDNIFDHDIVDIINHCSTPTPNAQKIADELMKRAREVAEDSRGVSPFQDRAIQEGFYYQGGKVDDVTIVVGVVKVAEDSPDRR